MFDRLNNKIKILLNWEENFPHKNEDKAGQAKLSVLKMAFALTIADSIPAILPWVNSTDAYS